MDVYKLVGLHQIEIELTHPELTHPDNLVKNQVSLFMNPTQFTELLAAVVHLREDATRRHLPSRSQTHYI